MTKRKGKGRIGSSFDDFLDEEEIRGEVEDAAIKEIVADQIAPATQTKDVNKAQARRMDKSLEISDCSATWFRDQAFRQSTMKFESVSQSAVKCSGEGAKVGE